MISRRGFSDQFSGAQSRVSPKSCRQKFAAKIPQVAVFLLLLVGWSCLLASSWSVFAAENAGESPIWLIKNNWKHSKDLPKFFRKMHDSQDVVSKTLSKNLAKGLDLLNASGSGQCSQDNFEAIISAIGPFKIMIIDLRQESHGFINKELPVSWYRGQDDLNWGKSLAEIETDESKRLDDLVQAKTALFYDLVKPSNDPNAPKVGINPEKTIVSSAVTESGLCKTMHLAYMRIPVADYKHPADEWVDKFVKLVRSLSAREWLHFHSGVDDGRTTVFLAMYDMMHNADKVGFNEIIERQQMLGGVDLLQSSASKDRKIPFMEERARFMQEFYVYCAAEISHKFSTSWSKWKKKN